MEKIALITERRNGSVENGSTLRDKNLLVSLEEIAKVDVFYNDLSGYGRWDMLKSNVKIPSDIEAVLKDKSYDRILVSTFTVSPCFLTYAKINSAVIYYLCDSAFHMVSQYLNFKIKLITLFLTYKERKALQLTTAAYLGQDEIDHLPKRYQAQAMIIPFHIKLNENLFDKDGFVTFAGDFSFAPNRQALNKIIELAQDIDIQFKLFGSNFPTDVELPSNVSFLGYAESIIDLYKGARALIYPVQYGTGVKNKVIEAMSYGIPIIGYKEAFTNIKLSEIVFENVVDNEGDFKCLLSSDLTNMSFAVHDIIAESFSKKAVVEKISSNLS